MDIETLNAKVETLNAKVDSLLTGLDTWYLLWAATLVFLMQAGFAMLEAGSIRMKNVKNVLLKNVLDACIGALIWYTVGHGIAYDQDTKSDANNGFMGVGHSNFAIQGGSFADKKQQSGYDHAFWQFQYVFAATAATIVSGAVAERCQITAYLIYTTIITGFIYPVVVHWVWDGSGWLSAFNADATYGGLIDFAGSGVVHMTGGVAALAGAIALGPRIGRWASPEAFEGHSTPLQVIGTFLLWFGWYGFNPGSTLMITPDGYARDAARATVTTTLAAGGGGLLGMLLKRFLPRGLGGSGLYDIGHTCNSILGGLVGITAGCSVTDPWAALLIGFISAIVYHGTSCLMRKIKIDDPLDAFAVHGACGLWGLLAVGLFANSDFSYAPNADSEYFKDFGKHDSGIFMYGTKGLLFGTQIIGILTIFPWVLVTSGLMFYLLKLFGLLRVSKEEEISGLDGSKHGGSAYPVNVTSTEK